ncbi:MAG: hypothetical protein ABIJ30_03445 [bacterium]
MKTLLLVEDREGIVEEVVFSYESSEQKTADVFNTTYQILQNSILDARQEKERIGVQLRENLAKNKSLRKKDFDNMMQNICLIQDEGGKEVKDLVNNYLYEQEETSRDLRKGLRRFQDSFANGESKRIKEFQVLSKNILDEQEKRKQEIALRLKDIQKEQQEVTRKFKELLDRGRDLRIKDIKSMLKEFSVLHEERMARQEERKEEVRKMLDEFRKERVEVSINWQMMQKEMSKRRCPKGGM